MTTVVVVVHPDDELLAETCRRAGADVVVPALPPPDMKASVCHALARIATSHVPLDRDAWLLAPADMPRLTGPLIDAVIDGHEPAAPRILVPTCAGRRGHPVLFPWSLADEVEQLGVTEGLNALVGRNLVREVNWPSAEEFADVDNPADYRRLHDSG